MIFEFLVFYGLVQPFAFVELVVAFAERMG